MNLLHLLLFESKHSSIKQSIERVVVKFAYGHLNCLLVVVIDKLLQMAEHVVRVATLEGLHVSLLLFLSLCFHLGVKVNFRLESLILLSFLPSEVDEDALDAGTLLEKIGECSS